MEDYSDYEASEGWFGTGHGYFLVNPGSVYEPKSKPIEIEKDMGNLELTIIKVSLESLQKDKVACLN